MTLHKRRRASNIFLSEEQYTGSISTSRNATGNTTDGSLATYDNITNYNDEFEYRMDLGKQKITKIEITISVDQGEGWATDSNLDFYYIPPGETNPANYIWFGNFNYPGMINYTNHVLLFDIGGQGWVFADGVYMKFDQINIEGGWATLQEFKIYTTMGG